MDDGSWTTPKDREVRSLLDLASWKSRKFVPENLGTCTSASDIVQLKVALWQNICRMTDRKAADPAPAVMGAALVVSLLERFIHMYPSETLNKAWALLDCAYPED